MSVTHKCLHCNEEFPAHELVTEEIDGSQCQFCCHGCRMAYRIINGAGLGSFYQRPDRQPGTNKAAFEQRFDPDYLNRFVSRSGNRAGISLIVDGVRCASCVWVIERILQQLPGIHSARVNFATHRLRVEFDERQIGPHEICTQLSRIGYSPRPYSASEQQQASERERRTMLYRFGTAVFLSMQLMGFSIALYAGFFQGINPQTRQLLQLLAALVTTPVIFYSGFPFLRGAWFSLRNRQPNMDLLIALGSLSAYSYSLYALFRGGEVYFDTAAMVITLILAGRLFETSARLQASAGVDRLLKLAPEKASRRHGDDWLTVDSQQLQPGDIVRLSAGERFPADGRILQGTTEVDEAAISGEPLPVIKQAGDRVVSGTLNLTGSIEVEIDVAASESFIARVAALVEQAQARQAPIQRLADRIATLFIPLVLLLAAGTYLYWHGSSDALLHAIAVLVVACPCALGLATPTAVMVATGRAAEAGILFRGGDILEAITQIKSIAFDKTGTLTSGEPRVSRIVSLVLPEREFLQLLNNLAAGSQHPLARGIAAFAQQQGLVPTLYPGVQAVPGRGLKVVVEEALLLAGSRNFLQEEGISLANPDSPATNSEVHLARNGSHLGWAELSDTLRPETPGVCSRLRRRGLETLLLTGDRREVAEALSSSLGIDRFQAELTPAEKAELIEQMGAEQVMMVGDGINDAPALTTARIGCSLADSSDIAVESADLILTRPQLTQLPVALQLAETSMRIIRQNLCWAFSYNLIALPLAASGQLQPVYGAAAMALSSICVVGNSLRLKRIPLQDA